MPFAVNMNLNLSNLIDDRMKLVLQAEDIEGVRLNISVISKLLIFNTIFSTKLKWRVICSHRLPLIIFYYFIGIANNMFFNLQSV